MATVRSRNLSALLKLFVLVFGCVENCKGDNKWFNYHVLVNSGLSEPVLVESADACIYMCSTMLNCSALSYQTGSQFCLLSHCGNLILENNNGWNTYVLGIVMVEGKDVAVPQFEWMLTDRCGLGESGIFTNASAMVPTNTQFSNDSISILHGEALLLDEANGTYCSSKSSEVYDFDYSDDGFTFTGWFNLEMQSDAFAFFEFAKTDINGSYSNGTRFWYINETMVYTLVYSLNDSQWTNSLSGRYKFQMPLLTWVHVAMTYNPAIPGVNFYLNGTLVSTFNIGSPLVSHPKWNTVAIGSRPSMGNFRGSVFCVKMFLSAMTEDQIAAIGLSCLYGTIRFS